MGDVDHMSSSMSPTGPIRAIQERLNKMHCNVEYHQHETFQGKLSNFFGSTEDPVYLLFKVPLVGADDSGEKNKQIKWWNDILAIPKSQKLKYNLPRDTTYTNFFHDGVAALSDASMGPKREQGVCVDLYAVTVPKSVMVSVDGECDAFRVLGDLSTSIADSRALNGTQPGFCISGGCIRTKLVSDTPQTKRQMVCENGRPVSVELCEANEAFVFLEWHAYHAHTVGYKRLHGTQVCLSDAFTQHETVQILGRFTMNPGPNESGP
jgi:hypothetical protein